MADPKSWNPWHGCRRYSEGCKFCYMFVLDKAHHVPESSTEIVRTKMFGKPLEMTRKGWYKTAVSTNRLPSGYTLRVNMTSDTFLEEADGWRTEMWSIIRRRPDVIFYILTKRVPRIMECLPEDWGDGYENVDLNMTCETQQEQGRQAYRSGLSRFFGKPKYRLYHPVDGHLLEEGELMVPRFNIHRCLECTSVPTCVGCTDCGSCKQVELVSMERLMEMREQDKNI